jgi:hypothetical protein
MYLCNIAMCGVRGVSTLYYKQAEIRFLDHGKVRGSSSSGRGNWQQKVWELAAEGVGMVGEQ